MATEQNDNIFDNPMRDDTLPDFVQDETPETEVAPSEPASEEVAETATTPDTQVAEEQPTEEQVKSWAGKYSSAEELEKGYRELRDLQRRTAERAKAMEQRAYEEEVRRVQYEQALQRAVPMVQQAQAIQQQMARRQQNPYGMDEPPQQPQYSPDQLANMARQQADYIAQQRIQQYQMAQAAQAQQFEEYQEAAQNFEAFFERHPEVERGGSVDEDIASTILALNEAWPDADVALDSPEALDLVYEASQRPALREVLELNPKYFDTDTGMALARKLAGEIDGITQEATPRGRGTAPRSNTPVVERGSSQAPPAGTPLDEFEQAVSEYRASQKRGSDVFFGG